MGMGGEAGVGGGVGAGVGEGEEGILVFVDMLVHPLHRG